jgi:short-subunit dehydrogenase
MMPAMTAPTTTSAVRRPLAVVTGASGGIGLELARLAAAADHDLVLVARSGPKLEALAAELAGAHAVTARAVVADLAAPDAARGIVEALDGAPVDVLVNNAGVGGHGRFAVERTLAEDLAMIQLDITSLVQLTGLLLPGMVARRQGGILNVASTAGFLPGPRQAVYYASKAFVKSFSEALTEECRGDQIRVTALCPGPVDPGFAETAGLQTSLLMRAPGKVSAADVARAGWDGLAAGRAVVVPGLLTRAAMQSLRVAPRRLAAGIAGKLNG